MGKIIMACFSDSQCIMDTHCVKLHTKMEMPGFSRSKNMIMALKIKKKNGVTLTTST